MKTNEALSLTRHDEVWSLLPWYVNQTLPDDECLLVEQHLKVCVSCRGELKIQRKLCQGVRESVTENVCEQVQFSQLLKKIHAETQPEAQAERQPEIQPEKSANITLFSGFRVRAAAVAALLLMLALPFSGLFEQAGVNYRTLSSPIIGSGGRPDDIRVIFEESLGDGQRQALLSTVKGAIVEQADSRGVYIIRLTGQAALAPDEISMAIKQLRQQPGIIFAEPVTATGS